MTEKTFKKDVSKLSKNLTDADREQFLNNNKEAIDAIIYIKNMAKMDKNIDDWECWLGNILFK